MADTVRVMVERGNKKVVASAFDWLGWERSGQSEEDALQVLEHYRARYTKVAEIAGLARQFDAAREVEVVERLDGTGTTDFHGISARSATAEYDEMSAAECERKIALLRASWVYFDDVAARVSAQLRKGPRGGGRDRDQIVRHTLGVEAREFAVKIGVITPLDAVQTPDGLCAHREAYCEAIRDYNRRGLPARTWTLQFLLRRSAYHMLDHAWELQDKDRSPAA